MGEEYLSQDDIGSGRVGAGAVCRTRGPTWREIAAHR